MSTNFSPRANEDFELGQTTAQAMASTPGVREQGVAAPVESVEEAPPQPNQGIIDRQPQAAYLDIAKIAGLLAGDGGFQLRRKERDAIIDFLTHQAALLKQLESWTHDAVRKKYNETFQLGRPSFEENLARARDARAQIKARLRQGNKGFAPTALAIFERARLCAQTCRDIILENELSRCEWLGIPHEPSNVLRAANQGLVVFDRLVQSAREGADKDRVAMVDVTGLRVLGITLDSLASVAVEED